jgi:fibronectin-binding autotransporter adhesin
MASVSWTATTGGAWNSSNWSTGAAPHNGDDVTINVGESITVTYSTGSYLLDSLSTGSTDLLDMTGGNLGTQGNGYNLQGGLTISGGTMRLVAGGQDGGQIAGILTQSAGTLNFINTATIQGGTLVQSGGSITIAHGILMDQDNAGTLGGTISGAGEFDINNSGATTLQSGFSLSTAAFAIDSGTVFLNEKLNYANRFSLSGNGTLDMNGNAVTLSGHDSLDGTLNGGSLTMSGTGSLRNLVLDNGANLILNASINQTGNIQLGGSTGTGTLNIGSTGTLRITGNDSLTQGNNAGYLNNAGLIEKVGGGSASGTTQILDTIANTGTIDAAIGTIDFSGPGGGVQSTVSGTLMGAGTVAFSNGNYLLQNLTVDTNQLLFNGSNDVTLGSALTYGGNWQQTGGLLLFENNLTLTAGSETALDGGELKGTATIIDNGALTLGNNMQLEGNLSFMLNGNVSQTGGINFGDISDSVDQATVAAGTTWNMEGNSFINGAFGTITNLGTFAKASGVQIDTVQSNLINNTGTVLVDSGTLSLSGQGSLGSTVAGPGVLDISGQFTLESGLALSVGELILDTPAQGNDIQASLAGNLTYANIYAQEGGTLALDGNTLTLTGTTTFNTGEILGSGAVIVNGAALIQNVSLAQGGVLQFNGVTEQTGNVYLTGGSTAPDLIVGKGGNYTLDNGLYIGGGNNSVIGTLTVAGSFTAAGSNPAEIGAAVVDTGTIQISHGQMTFLGPLSGKGEVTLSAGGILALDNTATTSTGVTFGTGGGLLYLQDPAAYTGTLGGFATGDSVELNGFAFQSNGTLTTFSVSGDQVTITEANGPSETLNFSSAQSTTTLMLGIGPHGGVALIHI